MTTGLADDFITLLPYTRRNPRKRNNGRARHVSSRPCVFCSEHMTQAAAPGIDGSSKLRPMAPPVWLPKEVWPFDARALDMDAGSIAVSEVGKGPTLLFYTGIGSFIWRDVVLRLSDTFHCVIVDPPGIGLSGRTTRAAATLANSARAVGAVVRALDLQD